MAIKKGCGEGAPSSLSASVIFVLNGNQDIILLQSKTFQAWIPQGTFFEKDYCDFLELPLNIAVLTNSINNGNSAMIQLPVLLNDKAAQQQHHTVYCQIPLEKILSR